MDANLQPGSKVIVNTGVLALYGVIPGTTFSRLTKSINPGDTSISVASSKGWAVGDKLVVSASEFV